MVIPPLCEQEKIVSFLDEKIPLIESAFKHKSALLEELEIYKKSLIYEVVTGKKEII
jgi:type I restriction enzyme S subunit